MTIFQRHKKVCVIIGIVLILALSVLYLYAMLLPGVWHGDAFLYRQKDGSFAGSETYGHYYKMNYKMNIEKTDDGADVSFSVNDTKREYDIIHNTNDIDRSVKIFENGELVFEGRAHDRGGEYLLLDENYDMADSIRIYVDNQVPDEEELFPGYTRLYNWSIAEKYDIRGNPAALFVILLFGIILFIDIKFPDFFWILEHRLHVDGGEPSDWYRLGQKFGRILLIVGIFVFVILTFTIH